MAWIETHQTLIHHRKTNRAIALLKCNRYKFVGHMVTLWLWALDQAPSGNFGDLLPEEIADAAGWDPSKGEVFVNALIAVGFIDEGGDDGLRLHNWEKYTGLLMKRREAGRKGGIASGEARRTKQTDDVLEANTNGASTPTSPHLTSPTKPTEPYLTGPASQTALARREELKDKYPLTSDEWATLIQTYGGAANARYWEYLDYVGEDEEKRKPKYGMFVAYKGFLEKKRGVEYSARSGGGGVLREVKAVYG